MAILTAEERKKLPDTAFALPGRRYPVHNKAHAQAALSRVSQYGSSTEKAMVRAAVKKKFPNMGKENEAKDNTKEEAAESPAQEKAEMEPQKKIQKMWKK